MKKILTIAFALLLTVCLFEAVNAQGEAPGPELDVFNSEIGEWDVEIKGWAGPGDPTVSKGSETNRMLGGFWMISDFKGEMFGMDFEGHGVYSYDKEKKQYFGSWIDSLGSPKMDMTGKYDAEKKVMTYEGMAPGMDGSLAKHVISSKVNDDGTRLMTMTVGEGENAFKLFEMKYTKRAVEKK